MLLSGFISLTPITTIIACNKKDQIDDGSDGKRNVELLNQIKTEINKEFEQKESSVLDYKSFIGLSQDDLFNILNDYYTKMASNNKIEIDNPQISQYFINKINAQLVTMNTRLKNQITQLSNASFNIVSIGANSLFLEKLSYKQIIDIIKSLDQNTNYDSNSNSSKIFKLKFNLSFKIQIDNIREEEYVFPELQHFITDNTKDIFGKLSNISNSLRLKLQESKISLEQLLTNQGESKSNLNQKFIEAIKNEFDTKNPELNLKFNKLATTIKDEDLKINLKSLKHSDNEGFNENVQRADYYKNFVKVIVKSNINMIESLYTNNEELKKINNNRVPIEGSINIKELSYTPLNLSINDILIPMVNPIKTYLTLDYTNFIKYLEQFRTFLDEYFTLIKAGEVEFIHMASRKHVTIKRESVDFSQNIEPNGPVGALLVDFKNVILPQMKDDNKHFFKMNINGFSN